MNNRDEAIDRAKSILSEYFDSYLILGIQNGDEDSPIMTHTRHATAWEALGMIEMYKTIILQEHLVKKDDMEE